MFDIGWQEIFLIAVVALIVIGPKDLPRALKTVTSALRKDDKPMPNTKRTHLIPSH